jgi:DNA-binding CsgD family transcriptional regulator
VSKVAGRDAELAVLGAALAGVRSGRGLAVLVEGEAGIGKSALLAAALATQKPGQVHVVQGQCDELTQRFPLSAVQQALSGREAAAAAQRTPAGEQGSGVTAGIAPRLVPSNPVLEEIERLSILVHRLCADGPLALVLEDMHWADEASMLFWLRLCRVTPQLPLLLLGTRRPVPRVPRAGALSRVVRDSGGVVVQLSGLAADEVASMAADLVRARPGTDLLRWLERAAGNPFYVRELLDAAARSGALSIVGETAELAVAGGPYGLGKAVEAMSLGDVVADRLDFLSADALRVLRIAALLGPEFSVSDLAAVSEHTPVGLLPVLDDAIAAGVLESAGASLRFRHALLQQELYEVMPMPVRAGLHRQAAQALIGLDARPDRVAGHLVAMPEADAGEGWEADWLASHAAVLAVRVPAVAVDLLERALGRLGPDDPRRPVLEDHLADTLFLLGRYEQVGRVCLVTLARTCAPDRYGRLSWLLVYALLRLRRHKDAVLALDIAAEQPGLSAVWQARFVALRAMVLMRLGAVTQALTAADQALVTGRELDDAPATAYALNVLAAHHIGSNDCSAALRLIDQALPLASSGPLLADLRLLLIYNRVDCTLKLGRYDEAWELAQKTLASSDSSGSPRLASLRVNGAIAAYELGRWDEALAELEAATEGEPASQLELYCYKIFITAHRDNWTEASRLLKTLRKITASGRFSWSGWSPDASIAAAEALVSEGTGDPGQALARLAEWVEPGTDDRPLSRQNLMPVVVRLALAAGDEPLAQAAAQTARSDAGRMPLDRQRATAEWCEGMVNGDPARVRHAAAVLRGAAHSLDEGSALEDAAVLLAKAGDRAAARAMLGEALDVYAQLGASWDAHRATARMRPFGIRRGVRGPRRRPDTGWAALTTMELQVAGLLTAGKSNPEIAVQLFISRRTVESHVSHILDKLRVASRWEVRAPG